ncbi:MAG: membrane protein insertion efficiency factor YidD [Elusimicrobia bacterium]|nr:membrane protein insertion efficiency factor YidD [Elusimicrobiota bacterium]
MILRTLRDVLILLVRLYQSAGFFWKPRCRYWPSCSEYCREALFTHGVGGGIFLTARRLVRCHPWGGNGYDPVPHLQQKALP